MIPGVDDLAIGRTLRALRRRRRQRQVDLAALAGVSQQLISRIECGRLRGIPLTTIRKVFAAFDADVAVTIRWHGGELDRFLDARHAEIVGLTASLLRRWGWQVLTEVTYAESGERGSIDLLAWHAETRTLLVIEVKSEIASAEELLRRHDAKVRLAPGIGLQRFGERPAAVGRLLAISDGTTNRRRIGHLQPVLGSAYPSRGAAARRWLRAPAGAFGGVLFVRIGAPTARRVSRVRRPSALGT